MTLQLHCRAHWWETGGKEEEPQLAVDYRLYYFYFFSSQNSTKKSLCLLNVKKEIYNCF